MIITICSSVDFSPEIIRIKALLEKAGHEVHIPYFTQKMMRDEISYEAYMETKEKHGGDLLLRESQSMDMIKRYWGLIERSDAILVLNLSKKGIENYIGGSTLMEMGFAYGQSKTIYLFNPPPLRSERMHYVDEIMDMKPIIIHQDLTRIHL